MEGSLRRWMVLSALLPLCAFAGAAGAKSGDKPRGDDEEMEQQADEGAGADEGTSDESNADEGAAVEEAKPKSLAPTAATLTVTSSTATAAVGAQAIEDPDLPPTDEADGSYTGDAPPFDKFACPGGADLEKQYVICADVAHSRIQHAGIFPATGGVVLPNKSFLIRVLHPADQKIRVTLKGQKGVYTPSLRTDMSRGEGKGKPRPVTWVVGQWILPPVLPDSAVISIQLADASGALLDEIVFDLVVERTYMGALRVGVGAVGLGATNSEYAVTRVGTSPQGQISALAPAQANFEVVVGYAAFLERTGRPVSGCRGGLSCFAPYLGLGVLSQNDDKLSFLQSIHAGVDWEPAPSFSVALTFVARRVDRLKPGLLVGGPAPSDESLTQQRVGFGAGLVFNVSPQFLKVAKHGGLF